MTWFSIFQVLAKLLSVFPLLPCPQTRRGQSCSSIAENDFGTFDEFNVLFYFYVFTKACCKGKSKVQPESLLGVRWQQRSSGELPRFSFPASTWSPCYLSAPSHWQPEHRICNNFQNTQNTRYLPASPGSFWFDPRLQISGLEPPWYVVQINNSFALLLLVVSIWQNSILFLKFSFYLSYIFFTSLISFTWLSSIT